MIWIGVERQAPVLRAGSREARYRACGNRKQVRFKRSLMAMARRSGAEAQGLYSRTLKTWVKACWLPRSRLARPSRSAVAGVIWRKAKAMKVSMSH